MSNNRMVWWVYVVTDISRRKYFYLILILIPNTNTNINTNTNTNTKTKTKTNTNNIITLKLSKQVEIWSV